MLKFIQNYHTNAYEALAMLNKAFFDSYVKQESLVKQCKKIYQRHVRFIKVLQHARKHPGNLVRIERLHEVICSLHLLRFRFNEFALFEICFREMQAIQKISTLLLYKMKNNANVSVQLNEFMNAIHAFENLYSHTLQVVARDPHVFQFFIQDLYVLYDVIKSE